MRYIMPGEVVELHRRLLQTTGGAPGIRDFGALESGVAKLKATFAGSDLHPTLPTTTRPRPVPNMLPGRA